MVAEVNGAIVIGVLGTVKEPQEIISLRKMVSPDPDDPETEKVVLNELHTRLPGIVRKGGKHELTENDCCEKLGYSWVS